MTEIRYGSYSASAQRSETIYSDDIFTPFEDLGLGRLSHSELVAKFAGKRVLDIGSGQEGTARRLFTEFEGIKEQAPLVVSLNPQFADWRMVERNTKRLKQDDLLAAMKITMELSGEDYDGYIAQRVAVAGVVQALPFADKRFDIVVSTWGFPTCFYDFGGSDAWHRLGYREVERVLDDGGEALLGPIRHIDQQQHATVQLEEALDKTIGYKFKEAGPEGPIVHIIKPTAS